jgi:hypothetical protein
MGKRVLVMCVSAVTVLATLSEVATAEYAPPKLSMVAARSAASSKAASFNARSSAVDTVAFDGCQRRSRQVAACSFTARGRNTNGETTCSLRVAVRGQGSDTQARAPQAQCHSHSALLLSYADAKDAFFEYARENGYGGGIIIRKEELPRDLKRLSAATFSARIEAIDQVEGEVCSIPLVAERVSQSEVRVTRTDARVSCRQLPPLSDSEAMQAFEDYAARRGSCGKGIYEVTRTSATRVEARVDVLCDSEKICAEWTAAERSPSGGVSVGIASDAIGCRRTEG